jgi:hypothetical protein
MTGVADETRRRPVTLSSELLGRGSQDDRFGVCGDPHAKATTALVRRDEEILAELRAAYRMALQLSALGANGE